MRYIISVAELVCQLDAKGIDWTDAFVDRKDVSIATSNLVDDDAESNSTDQQ